LLGSPEEESKMSLYQTRVERHSSIKLLRTTLATALAAVVLVILIVLIP
jgi:hypothetical protein